MYVLGLSFFYHDSAACLLKDGVVIAAAEEERFSRVKHDPGFPHQAIQFCLQFAGIELTQVEAIVFYEKPFLKFERILIQNLQYWPWGWKSFPQLINLWLSKRLNIRRVISQELKYQGEIFFTQHHHSHAASSFFTSPFSHATVVTVDGVGEWAALTISAGSDGLITPQRQINYPNSLGLLYSAFTYFLGFEVNEGEYKVMGLAPYGTPVYLSKCREIVAQNEDGSFTLNAQYFSFLNTHSMICERKWEKLFNFSRRKSGQELKDCHKNLAASIQVLLEELLLKIIDHAYQKFPHENLCLAGGVALNCVANSKIVARSRFKNVHIYPAAGDSGGAVGAALAYWHEYLKAPRQLARYSNSGVPIYLGPEFSSIEIKRAVTLAGLPHEQFEKDALLRKTAQALDNQKIVGWFQGRMEFGPRALGNRSILADARNKANWAKINKVVKFREDFRPFAPVICEEFLADYFQTPLAQSPFMLFTAQNKTSQLPATTHVDGSSRVQTVNAQQNKLFYDLLKCFYQLTQTPVLINTSFNAAHEPIVGTPQDAIRCFLETGLDVLVIGEFWLEKNTR